MVIPLQFELEVFEGRDGYEGVISIGPNEFFYAAHATDEFDGEVDFGGWVVKQWARALRRAAETQTMGEPTVGDILRDAHSAEEA